MIVHEKLSNESPLGSNGNFDIVFLADYVGIVWACVEVWVQPWIA